MHLLTIRLLGTFSAADHRGDGLSEMGAADFLRKPVRREVFLPRVHAILQRKERVSSERPQT